MGIFPMGNSDRFPQGKPAATEPRYPTLINYKVHAGSFRVSINHWTLNMDYRIFKFNFRTWSLLCVRIHMGVGYTDSESAQHFGLGKLPHIFLVFLSGFKPRVFGSWVRHSTNWATPFAQLELGLPIWSQPWQPLPCCLNRQLVQAMAWPWREMPKRKSRGPTWWERGNCWGICSTPALNGVLLHWTSPCGCDKKDATVIKDTTVIPH